MKNHYELELTIDGSIQPGDRGDRNNPPEPAYVEDLKICLTRIGRDGVTEKAANGLADRDRSS